MPLPGSFFATTINGIRDDDSASLLDPCNVIKQDVESARTRETLRSKLESLGYLFTGQSLFSAYGIPSIQADEIRTSNGRSSLTNAHWNAAASGITKDLEWCLKLKHVDVMEKIQVKINEIVNLVKKWYDEVIGRTGVEPIPSPGRLLRTAPTQESWNDSPTAEDMAFEAVVVRVMQEVAFGAMNDIFGADMDSDLREAGVFVELAGSMRFPLTQPNSAREEVLLQYILLMFEHIHSRLDNAEALEALSLVVAEKYLH